MNSKEILPEDERQDYHAELMVRMPDFGPDLWNALLAAESEVEELTRKNKAIEKVLVTMASALETVKNLKENNVEQMIQDIDVRIKEIRNI